MELLETKRKGAARAAPPADQCSMSFYLLHQIVKCDLTAVFESRMGQHQAAEEISNLAHVIYLQENEDGFRKASSASDSLRAHRDARRAKQAPATAIQTGPVKPADAKPARTRSAS